ncbi:hydantoinase B/oxoprolinase family protein [Pseudoduganella violacea]|uniref:5-oxoprolinase (ATP-hydrolyzing) n=1 Tax=Pseudoduganella violacea TaxID=1715466 RepID=A0A7W5BBW7_9BURK|nr:hydantoinase B/oxoprolinase family protein [Pseudoduganella violacea]MBB3119980.1 5-oxoprolinase (ATP-hydrolyzing) [Pseudoduganella violacea]
MDWQFWIDRGGTFTDIVARLPDGSLRTHKLLSEDPEHYADAALAGIRHLLAVETQQSIPVERIGAVKMGTTVATNALLERKGEPTALAITRGFGDALRIAYQNRPRLFDRNIVLPELLYRHVVEIDERMGAHGEVVRALDEEGARAGLQAAYDAGLRALAIVFMHGYRYGAHEQAVARIARAIGFTQISVSHQISPMMKLVARGDTTVVDAYLSPILRRYVDQVARELPGVNLQFMQSNGGLTDARAFQGKDSILSGPAGGIVGMVRASRAAGFERIIGFDMGGTSTDVSHFFGEFERVFETQVAGVRMRAPMMSIHTVAAGGGSILHFDGSRFRVGPDSAGANPGPASYRRGGPLTVTDCNVMLGKLQPAYFPKLFGADGAQELDADIVRERFAAMAQEAAGTTAATPEQIAEGFIEIAVGNMANAIKQISVQRGHDVTEYTLTSFGGAGGQHACLVADALGMKTVFIHSLAGVLSAYGMGLADQSVMREMAVEARLEASALDGIVQRLQALEKDAVAALRSQGVADEHIALARRIHLRYEGTDTALIVAFDTPQRMQEQFESAYKQRFSFLMPGRGLMVEAVSVEAIGKSDAPAEMQQAAAPRQTPLQPHAMIPMHAGGRWRETALFRRDDLRVGDIVSGPAIIAEANATTVLEPGWQAEVTSQNHLLLKRVEALPERRAIGTTADPVMLEIFNNLFMSIAEQMGLRLQNTAYSVNIKERLDFSCAIFDEQGNLIANAPHMPVHLGSMGESIKAVMRKNAGGMRPGDVYMLNDPYNGGTHLPDVTVISPVFDEAGQGILFYVGSRGHHADIGGTTPGSMPPDSRHIEEEGVLFDNFKLVDGGRLRDAEARALLAGGPYPARNPDQNMADLRAQVAANQKGVDELRRMVAHFGLDVVRAYMGHVQDNAEEAVRRVISALRDGAYTVELDNGARIAVAIRVDQADRSAVIDFSGTSDQQENNFNAPSAVCMAAVLYVFRTLVDDDIPLNAGCLKPLQVLIPPGSMLNPHYPASVVSGNVETSTCITNALYGALGVMGASQGTMNNFTFGNARYQYYETISGGSGAGKGFDGTDVVQTNMTNSRLTDPEILEFRYPVRVESYAIRPGSGGKGRWRGGNGGIRKIRFLEEMTAAILSNNRRYAPFGMAGGGAGAVGRNTVQRADGRVEELGHIGKTQMLPGDLFIIETPGGGGYG